MTFYFSASVGVLAAPTLMLPHREKKEDIRLQIYTVSTIPNSPLQRIQWYIAINELRARVCVRLLRRVGGQQQ